MDNYEQVLLEAAKDAFEVLTEDGESKEEALTTIKDMYDSPNRSEEFKKELEALKEEDLEIPFSDVDFGKEEKTSLDDLIKSAVEKTEDQPIKNNPVKEMER
jgi:hypothetical protein